MKRYVMIVMAGLALLASCAQNTKPKAQNEAKGTEEQVPVFAVGTTRAVKGQIRDYLALSGDIVSGTTVDAYSDVAGKVTKLYVSVGQRVEKDEPLAEVDPSRPGMTFNTGVVKAPISGTVIALPAQLGMTISQAVPVARLAGSGSLEARAFVAERFISKMRVGLPVELTLDAYPGRTFYGRVRELSPTVDPVSRTMEVRITVKNEDNALKTGMFAKIKIITEEKSSIVKIPAAAIVRRYGEQYVFTVETDPKDPAFTIAHKRIVTPGILIDDQAEIREGLEADAEVVLRGQSLLEDGVRVRVVETTAPLKTTY
ncbi:MAG TPA: efflux RND transporter periplasmic adaptor subunit [Treponema sp.]|nr:efflux RND transporter periplasmic adaptor subunit [Treponema sp.]